MPFEISPVALEDELYRGLKKHLSVSGTQHEEEKRLAKSEAAPPPAPRKVEAGKKFFPATRRKHRNESRSASRVSIEAQGAAEVAENDSHLGDPLHVLQIVNPAAAYGANSVSHHLNTKLWAYGMNRDQLHEIVYAKTRQKQRIAKTWPPWRVFCLKLIDRRRFKLVCICANITYNACLYVVANNVDGEARTAETFMALCLPWFALELMIRACGDLSKRWLQGWLVADVAVLVAASADMALAALFTELGFQAFRCGWLRAFMSFRLLRLLRLGQALRSFRPLHVLVGTVAKGWQHLAVVSGFSCFAFLTLAIFMTTLLGKPAASDLDDPELQLILIDLFGSMPRSVFSILEFAATGGILGRNLNVLLLGSEDSGMQAAGYMLICVSTFIFLCLVNLLLGVFVNQVVKIAHDHDKEEETRKLYDGHENVEQLRLLLEAVDTNNDGHLTVEEIQNGMLLKDKFAMRLGLGAAEIKALHQVLDTEGTGKVAICEFLFGVLKLSSASKTIDMLTIDYRQKMVLREITRQEHLISDHIGELDASLQNVVDFTDELEPKIQSLNAQCADAARRLELRASRITRAETGLDQDLTQREVLLSARRDHDHLEAKEHLAQRVRRLTEHLNTGRGHEPIPDTATLRSELRRRLDEELRPWLEEELARRGGTGSDL